MQMSDSFEKSLKMNVEGLIYADRVSMELQEHFRISRKLRPLTNYCHNFRQQNSLGADTDVGNIYRPGLDNVLIPRLLQEEKEKESEKTSQE